jgi:hypothetical protein
MCSKDRFTSQHPLWTIPGPYLGDLKSPPDTPRPAPPQPEPPRLKSDPDIEDTLAQMARTRTQKGIQQMTAALGRLARSYREFSMKTGKKDGFYVVEISVPPFEPAAAVSRSLDYAIVDAERLMRRKVDPHGVITALDEKDLDSAVTELEDIGSDDSF